MQTWALMTQKAPVFEKLDSPLLNHIGFKNANIIFPSKRWSPVSHKRNLFFIKLFQSAMD